MLNNPSAYLNGTAPLDTTGAIKACVFQEGGGGENCTIATGTDKDSFLWYVWTSVREINSDARCVGTTSSILANRQTEL